MAQQGRIRETRPTKLNESINLFKSIGYISFPRMFHDDECPDEG
ncbi:hypothetical protein PUN4_540002 [Paraburkholderia unamae]|nr:hypothetical protein PUN4_540002 [Paraburkholderia unamae]